MSYYRQFDLDTRFALWLAKSMRKNVILDFWLAGVRARAREKQQ
jgi:hypothetical protein